MWLELEACNDLEPRCRPRSYYQIIYQITTEAFYQFNLYLLARTTIRIGVREQPDDGSGNDYRMVRCYYDGVTT